MNNNKQGIASSRKLKYGTLSAGFVVVVVVLCVAINLMASGLSAKWDLRVDITDSESRFYTISDATKSLIEKNFKDDPDWKITFTFLAEEKKVSDKMVLEMARSYESLFNGHINIRFVDIHSDPVFADKYTQITQTALTPSHVLVEGKYHTRAVNFAAFYYYDSSTGSYDPVAFTGEKTYTSAIMRAGLKESPKAVFTVGHGETLDGIDLGKIAQNSSSSIEDVSPLVPFFDSLFDMGFEVRLVDLDKEELPTDTRLVVVCDPKYDFLSFDKENPEAEGEIDVLRKYMNSYNASLLVAVNSSTPSLPNLMEYLEQDYGLGYVQGALITDNTNSIKGSGGKLVLGKAPSSLEYSLDEKILSVFGGGERFVFNDAVKLTVSTDPRIQGDGVLINTHSTASCEGEEGVYPLFAFTTNAEAVSNPEGGGDGENKMYKTAYLLGSTDFLSSSGLVSQYANRDLLESVMRVANTTQSYIGIKEVFFADEALNITTGAARLWTIIVTAAVPAAVFCIAAAVWIKRRHS
ncbi:MAG: Gldg family protein [Clostridia bacterium]|nr:Gldg family protein [Clostridia bacterium]